MLTKGGCGEEWGGGLAAAVTSSFMNSLYFCSVQNKRTFLLKKRKKKRIEIRSLVSSSSPSTSSSDPSIPPAAGRLAGTVFRFGWSYEVSRKRDQVSIPAPEFTGTILSGLRSDHGIRSTNAVLIRERDSTLFDGVVRSRGRRRKQLPAFPFASELVYRRS